MPEESVSGCRYKPTFSAKALGNEYAAWVSRQGIYTVKTLTEDLAMNSRERRALRYRAKCAAVHIESANYIKRIDSAFTRLSDGCSKRVLIAVSAAESKGKPDYQRQIESRADALERSKKRIAYKDANPLGNKIHAVQKVRGKSIPLV